MYTPWSVIAGETPTATKWNLLGGNDADFDSRLTQLVADNTVESVSDGATVTLNMATGRLKHVQIAGNRTIAFSNVGAKRPFGVFIQQDGSGNRSVTWPAGIDWAGGSAPTLSVAPNKTDLFIIFPKPTWVASSNEVYYGAFGGFNM